MPSSNPSKSPTTSPSFLPTYQPTRSPAVLPKSVPKEWLEKYVYVVIWGPIALLLCITTISIWLACKRRKNDRQENNAAFDMQLADLQDS